MFFFVRLFFTTPIICTYFSAITNSLVDSGFSRDRSVTLTKNLTGNAFLSHIAIFKYVSCCPFFSDLLTLEKTHQVADLWYWYHLKPQLGPPTKKNQGSYSICLYYIATHSHVEFLSVRWHYLVAVESIVLQEGLLHRKWYYIVSIYIIYINCSQFAKKKTRLLERRSKHINGLSVNAWKLNKHRMRYVHHFQP